MVPEKVYAAVIPEHLCGSYAWENGHNLGEVARSPESLVQSWACHSLNQMDVGFGGTDAKSSLRMTWKFRSAPGAGVDSAMAGPHRAAAQSAVAGPLHPCGSHRGPVPPSMTFAVGASPPLMFAVADRSPGPAVILNHEPAPWTEWSLRLSTQSLAPVAVAGERFSRCRGRLPSASRRCCPGWHWNTGIPDVRRQRSAPLARGPEPAAGSHRALRRS